MIRRLVTARSETPAERWAAQIEGLCANADTADRAAWWLHLLGLHRAAARAERQAADQQTIAERMRTCPRNPATGGADGGQR